jgi:hypothetical protein
MNFALISISTLRNRLPKAPAVGEAAYYVSSASVVTVRGGGSR